MNVKVSGEHGAPRLARARSAGSAQSIGPEQKLGGWAALVAAATFVFGIAMAVTVLSDYTIGDPSPAESVAFLMEHQSSLYVWNTVIFIVFGVALVPLVLSLHARERTGSPLLAQTTTALGLIWAGLVVAAGMIGNIAVGTVVDLNDADPGRALPVWSSLDAVQNGLGGGIEIVGGLWVLLVSWVALRGESLPRGLSYLGVIAGVAGVVTVVPSLEAIGGLFGLGLIVWFTWAGLTMLRSDPGRPTSGVTA